MSCFCKRGKDHILFSGSSVRVFLPSVRFEILSIFQVSAQCFFQIMPSRSELTLHLLFVEGAKTNSDADCLLSLAFFLFARVKAEAVRLRSVFQVAISFTSSPASESVNFFIVAPSWAFLSLKVPSHMPQAKTVVRSKIKRTRYHHPQSVPLSLALFFVSSRQSSID